MCFIYQFANHPKYSPLTNSIFDKLNHRQIKASTSTISLIETLVLPERRQQPELVEEYTKVFDLLPNLNVISIDKPVAHLTAKLRATYPNIRTPDAIQLSTAILAGCKIFVTNNIKLKQVTQISVLVLSEYNN
jgi:predicted nucleic acid-binding protein